jgi:hypothetical protein
MGRTIRAKVSKRGLARVRRHASEHVVLLRSLSIATITAVRVRVAKVVVFMPMPVLAAERVARGRKGRNRNVDHARPPRVICSVARIGRTIWAARAAAALRDMCARFFGCKSSVEFECGRKDGRPREVRRHRATTGIEAHIGAEGGEATAHCV